MKKLTLIVAAGACTAMASANMIINGSFEFNSSGVTQYNMDNTSFNLTVSGVTAFGGSNELDIITGAEYGHAATDGSWKSAFHSRRDGSAVDALSFDLNSGIVSGTTYSISFDSEAVTTFDSNNGPIQIGISNSATDFGTLVYSGPSTLNAWGHNDGSFVAGFDALYLTVRNDPSVSASWIHVDNFQLNAVPEPSSLIAFAGLGVALLASRRRKA